MGCLDLLEGSSKPWAVVSLNRLCSVTGGRAAGRLAGKNHSSLRQGAGHRAAIRAAPSPHGYGSCFPAGPWSLPAAVGKEGRHGRLAPPARALEAAR